ncbi:MAG: hypothetical protein JWP11_3717 [Frankiales bacterium]|nr:hypothetical protein [Frankiales bacterium]
MSADRAGYIAGLRALADALEADTALPLPDEGTSSELSVFVQTKTEAVAYARLLPGKVDKKVTDGHYGFELHGSLHGLRVLIYAPRAEVCERVVTGTREVTRVIRDPEALAAVPTTTVVETVEDVEWRCTPLLAPAPVSA